MKIIKEMDAADFLRAERAPQKQVVGQDIINI